MPSCTQDSVKSRCCCSSYRTACAVARSVAWALLHALLISWLVAWLLIELLKVQKNEICSDKSQVLLPNTHTQVHSDATASRDP